MKNQLGRKVILKHVRLRAKAYNSYLIDYSREDKKAKRTKKCVI